MYVCISSFFSYIHIYNGVRPFLSSFWSTRPCIRTRMLLYICIYMCACVYTCFYIYVCHFGPPGPAYLRVCYYTFVYIYVCVCVCTHVFICMYVILLHQALRSYAYTIVHVCVHQQDIHTHPLTCTCMPYSVVHTYVCHVVHVHEKDIHIQGHTYIQGHT